MFISVLCLARRVQQGKKAVVTHVKMLLVKAALVYYHRNLFNHEMATLVPIRRVIHSFVQRIQKLLFAEMRLKTSRPITQFQCGAKIILSLGARAEEWIAGWKGRVATTQRLCSSALSLFGPLR